MIDISPYLYFLGVLLLYLAYRKLESKRGK